MQKYTGNWLQFFPFAWTYLSIQKLHFSVFSSHTGINWKSLAKMAHFVCKNTHKSLKTTGSRQHCFVCFPLQCTKGKTSLCGVSIPGSSLHLLPGNHHSSPLGGTSSHMAAAHIPSISKQRTIPQLGSGKSMEGGIASSYGAVLQTIQGKSGGGQHCPKWWHSESC